MNLSEAISLLSTPLEPGPGVWADLGCGKGLFTRALARLLSDESLIYAVDRSRSDLEAIPTIESGCRIEKVLLDFETDQLPVHEPDGIMMANSLHYVKDQFGFLESLTARLKARGMLLLVEYDGHTANPWVPYPIGLSELSQHLAVLGIGEIRKIHQMPSRYGSMIYSLAAVKSA